MTLPAMHILGVGAVTPSGRDLEKVTASLGECVTPSPGTAGQTVARSVEAAVGDGSPAERKSVDPPTPPPPAEGPHPNPLPAYRERVPALAASDARGRANAIESLSVSDDLLADAGTAKRLRRADRFTRMAVIAASDAWRQAQPSLAGVPMERIGLIVSSGFGPHGRGFKFLDGLLDCGDSAALPTDFSHSVHGAAAAYITELLGLRGPSLSVTDFVCGFEQSVQLAQCWLAEGQCDRVLVGAVEELGPVLLHCAGRMLGDGFAVRPGEGAVFFMLGGAETCGSATLTVSAAPASVDLLVANSPAIGLSIENASTPRATTTTDFSKHFGVTASAAAFDLLGAYLSLLPGSSDGPLNSSTGDGSLSVDNAATFRPSCDPLAAMLLLTKSPTR